MNDDADSALPRTSVALQEGIDQGLHLGGQLYVSLDGEEVVDLAVGEARPGDAMRPDHLMAWLSASKPITAVALAQFWEESGFDLDGPVHRHISEFTGGGKDAITIRHLLTHTAGIRMFDTGWPEASWEEVLRRIYERKVEPNWVPGEKAGYHQASSWFVLGELLARLAGQPYAAAVRSLIFEPLGLADSCIEMPEERLREYGARLAPVWKTENRPPTEHDWNSADRLEHPSPGASGRGPMRELGAFYEMLLAGGVAHDGERLLTTQTVEALTARHRVGLLDHTFKRHLDWGLGFIIDSKHYGEADLPYGYGPHASHRTFGHSGYRSICAFADPQNQLVVTLGLNGTPSEEAHQARIEAICGAIYQDLSLASEER